MAAQAWKIYAAAKRKIGRGELVLSSGVFKMSLHGNGASGTITSLSAISIFSSIAAEISATGGYAAGGKAVAGAFWTVGASALQMKFAFTTIGIVWTGTGASINNIRYACIRKSVNSATSGHPLCYASLSSAQFSISIGNTLTISPHASGVFTMA